MRRNHIAFPYYGGKYSQLKQLLGLLPNNCLHYCEPFGGSASVLLNRKPSPLETYNDVFEEVVNFFRVLRSQRENLIKQIKFTPFSRKEYLIALELPLDLSDLERARRFYVRARQVRTGLAGQATKGRWAYCVGTSRRGVAGGVSRWLGGIEGLEELAKRLLNVQIEHSDAFECIKRYDSEKTLFYCDPPYLLEYRTGGKNYHKEMTASGHIELAKLLCQIKGRAAVSGYRCDLMDNLYEGWHRVDYKVTLHSVKKEKIESVWMNYLPYSTSQGTLS